MSDTNNQIAAKLRELRETLGLSQGEVAEKLHKTQSYVSRCETGKRRLDIFELEAFAKLYGKPISHFLSSNQN
ncbi:MAG: helix-turn-helix transcriptional regulator [Anaerolineales bacterium]|nr:helix-turn-helix transcriptional regulator [Anaerolineales bacterium]MCX7754023.1 helix-turn-helix transcriptional regulator [Anaerolineales bacterium]MDW8276771.1 helix-turn-helix transcriptional regulator [Anaerolineales bacterium]